MLDALHTGPGRSFAPPHHVTLRTGTANDSRGCKPSTGPVQSPGAGNTGSTGLHMHTRDVQIHRLAPSGGDTFATENFTNVV